jgi:hypothetical protein
VNRIFFSARVWQAATVLFMVFLIGAVTGMFGSLFFLSRIVPEPMPPVVGAPRLTRFEQFYPILEERWSTAYRLDVSQREQLHAALVDAAKDVEALRTHGIGDKNTIFSRLVNRVAKTLPPGKRVVFEQRSQALFARWGVVITSESAGSPSAGPSGSPASGS